MKSVQRKGWEGRTTSFIAIRWQAQGTSRGKHDVSDLDSGRSATTEQRVHIPPSAISIVSSFAFVSRPKL